jgi:hypothetical protein
MKNGRLCRPIALVGALGVFHRCISTAFLFNLKALHSNFTVISHKD